jgi:hypothetical protein
VSEHAAVPVELVDHDPNGLAQLLAALLEANIARNPSRRTLLEPGRRIGIVATDAEVAVTLELAGDRVRLTNGLASGLDLEVRATSTALLELSAAPLRLGLPDPASAQGRDAILGLARGRIRIHGMARHPRTVARLERLLSVR